MFVFRSNPASASGWPAGWGHVAAPPVSTAYFKAKPFFATALLGHSSMALQHAARPYQSVLPRSIRSPCGSSTLCVEPTPLEQCPVPTAPSPCKL
eukprot:5387160-Amphidinium_carterae.1